jgi:hypothetical protein
MAHRPLLIGEGWGCLGCVGFAAYDLTLFSLALFFPLFPKKEGTKIS